MATLRPLLPPSVLATLTGLTRWRPDPRLFQIIFQAVLLGAGVLIRDFSLAGSQFLAAESAALLTQLFWCRVLGVTGSGWLSPAITGFGISLLLRADNAWAHPLAACLAISAKFLLRYQGKHLFNPANLGVVFALLVLPGTWISPGQWGSDLAIAVWIIALGAWVATRSQRLDASWTFLAVFLGLCLLRVWVLGYPPGRGLEILAYQAQNGALLLFAFFMISDPMTMPDHPRARQAHAALVALCAFLWQFVGFNYNGPLWFLFLLAPLVPLWDRQYPAPRANWRNLRSVTGLARVSVKVS